MELQTVFEDICNELDIGIPKNQAIRLSGGYMHRMYRLQTAKGDYAIKLLNPIIMKRPDVFNNYKIAEELEEKLQSARIPIVPSLTFNNRKMQCVHGQYFYIFNHVDGKALKSEEILKEHCTIIGGVLAAIHKLETKNGPYQKDEINVDWDYYIQLANQSCHEIVPLLELNKSLLYTSQTEGNQSYSKLPSISCICNDDMDSKNVLWSEYHPYIIDLECLNYGNPFPELLNVALFWSGYEHYCVNFEFLEAFIAAYFKVYGDFQLDWSALYYSNNGRLSWLEYNIKRALMIECENEEERLLGIEQVKVTLKHIVYYDSIKEILLEKLEKLFV
jgi:Ser/Thr protein kinase RdoA (MazF antagonist)